MAIKSILCPYSGEKNSAAVLRYALAAARHHDAWLTGVVAHSPMNLERRFGGVVSQQILSILREKEDERSATIKRQFQSEVESAGWLEKAEFAEFEDNDDYVLSAFARGFDVVMIGAHSEDSSDTHLSPHPDVLTLQSGRPVLMIPDGFESDRLANHVLVAWDGKRAAARAVGEAMVMLEQKGKVTLVTVGKKAVKGVDGIGGIKTLMERHGVVCEHVHCATAPKGVGYQILSTADEIGAEMIVMGAYEHSKFSHELFGGATTDVMAHSEVPVMLVH
jgi:nucleotide-binding universal stress UspA family protein